MERMHEDARVSMKMRLSVMWTVIMFFYLYNDVFMLMHDGHAAGGASAPSESQLLAFAVMITPPALMPLLCQVLQPALNRWVNIVVGVAYFGLIVWTILPAGTAWFYRYIGVVENAITLAAIWMAWRWKRSAA